MTEKASDHVTETLRDLLQRRTCIGTFVKLPRAEVVEILALAGFDFLVCDMEHAQITEDSAAVVLAAASRLAIPVVVRLPDPNQGLINRLLEAGAQGIQVPRMRGASEARRLRDAVRFTPEGMRSIGRANTHARYGAVPLVDYVRSENARTMAIGQFETKVVEQPCETIMSNLDVAFIGPSDLSLDMGTPDNLNTPEAQSYLRMIERAAAAEGTVLGSFVTSIEQIKTYSHLGYRYLVVSGDTTMLSQGARSFQTILQAAKDHEIEQPGAAS